MNGCASAMITATTKDPKAHEIWTSRNLIEAFWPDDEIRRETRSHPFGMAGTPQLCSVYRSVCSRSFANPTHSATRVAIGVSLGGQFKAGPIRSRRGPGAPIRFRDDVVTNNIGDCGIWCDDGEQYRKCSLGHGLRLGLGIRLRVERLEGRCDVVRREGGRSLHLPFAEPLLWARRRSR
jgi:hypothetical protein